MKSTERVPLFVRDRGFYKAVLSLALPMTLQNVLSLLLSMLDTVMLGRINDSSEAVISAANLANQTFFVYLLVLVGLTSGMSVLVAQYWGKGDIDTINSVAGITAIAALSVSFIYTLICYMYTSQVMGIFSNSPEVIELGVKYLRYVLASYPISALTVLLSSVMRTTEQVKIVLFANSTAIISNAVLNYILIFGKLGLPALGIEGAAIATLLSRIIEFVIILVFVVFFDKRVRLTLKKMMKINRYLVKDFIRYSTPVIISESLWGLGSTIHSVIIGNMGEAAYAAYSVATLVERIGLLSCVGFATATQIIIGKEIGAGRVKNAYPYAKTMMMISTIMGVLMSGVILLVRQPVVSLFNVEDSTKVAAINIISVMAVTLFAKSFNTTAIVGIFRGGGATRIAMIFDLGPMWLISIPIGYVMAHVIKLPVWWVYACLMSDELIKVTFCWLFVISRRWIKNVTR